MIGIWLNPIDIEYSRIDSEFYDPEYVEHDRFVKKCEEDGEYPVVTLHEVAKLKAGPFGSKLPSSLYRNKGIPLFRSQNVVPFFPQNNNLVFLDPEAHFELIDSEVLPNQLLMSKAGRVGDSCILTKEYGPSNITEHVMGINPNDDVDPYYLVAALNASFSKKQAQRFGLGTLINYLGVQVSRSIKLVLPKESIQKAIGNKIRKAESLIKLYKISKNKLDKHLNDELKWQKAEHEMPNLSSWLSVGELEHRLDGKYNTPKRIGILRHLKNSKLDYNKLSDMLNISAMIGWKGLTTEHYTDEGPYLIRGIDIQDGLLIQEQLVKVAIEKYIEQPQIHLRPGDIIMTKDGTIGKAITVPNLNHEMCVGSTVARLRNKTKIPSEYFEAIINHDIIQIQIQSFATGLAQPHITQEWIAELIVPVVPSFKEVAESVRFHRMKLVEAKQLIEDAKLDIECLINQNMEIDKLLSEGNEIEGWLEENPITIN